MTRCWTILIGITIMCSSCKESKPTYNDVINSSKLETAQSSSTEDQVESGVESDQNSHIEEDVIKENIEKEELVETPPKEEIKEPAPKPVKKKVVKKNVVKKGVMTFESMVHEFGVIEQGDEVTHNFYFTNTGNAPINVKSCTATCGCTTPSYPFIPIAPGEKGYIGVTFNSTGKYGQQTPTVTVITDAKKSMVKLKLTGKVNAELEAVPIEVDTSGSSN